MLPLKLDATGWYAPPAVETAEDLAPRIGRSAAWIAERTGVLRRHVADEPVEAMAAEAARRALAGGPPPDLLVNASATPRQLIPDTAVFVARELGLDGVPCHTVHATCLSFLVALHNAGALVASGAYRRILVVSSELGTQARNLAEPESAALLGDGAAAAVIVPTPPGEDSALLGWSMATWPEGAGLAELRGAGVRRHPNDPATTANDNLFAMAGPRLFKAALRRAGASLDAALAEAGLRADEIDLVVPHQASGPALRALGRFGFAPDRVVDIVGEYGNCIAASLPMALAIAHEDGRVRRGDRLLLVGTGAGLSVAAAVLRF